MTSVVVELRTVEVAAADQPVPADNAVKPRAETVKPSAPARQRALELVADELGFDVRRHCRVCGQDGHGRPELCHRPQDISVTWAGRWGLVALASCRVGVDAELLGRATTPVSSTLSSAEVGLLASLPDRIRGAAFVRLWVAKEAVAKADGRGLTFPLAELNVASVLTHGRATVELDGTTWHVEVLDHTFPDGAPAAVGLAAERKIRRVTRLPPRSAETDRPGGAP